ncbi:hypothetical protein ABBQ32_007522 [Trebouxia sp. C0010 RCD-2024]
MGNYNFGIVFRGLTAGGVALGSKLAMMAKAGSGAGGVLKGIGALTAAGGAAAAVSSASKPHEQQQPRHYPPPPPQQRR